MSLIDYARAELRDSLHGARWQLETYVPVVCPACGGERWLRKYDAERAVKRGSTCASCQAAKAGSAGYQVTLAKYGRMFVMQKVREYRLLRITTLELLVARELTRHGVHFSREWLLPTKARGKRERVYILDDALWQPGSGALAGAIEVHGAFVHSKPERIRADKRKRALLKRRKVPLLEIHEDDINEGRMPGMVKSFLQALHLIEVEYHASRINTRSVRDGADRPSVGQPAPGRGARGWLPAPGARALQHVTPHPCRNRRDRARAV